ncbi:bidirectional sugar transporter NEC1-like isoform X2 [Salvia splendens]|uniref:bidirectional sugar transporter NEC1-like isoform X2 n=1 Tax=Salvia splendens TaxID=180675 RepID=UPI001C26466A|nr:bidirectional sugar transporter NEC1-like isoform X2 [Salvia splendens]
MAPNMANVFGILGNVVSFLVYLAPVPTFHRICKKKSTEGFQAIPYAVALFSAMLYLYYAFLKKNGMMLITINTFGGTIEVFTTKLILLLNVSSLGLITLCTYYFAHGHLRVNIVGWICAVFSVAVFVAPLSIMRQVVRTKSVEYMPFTLSCFLTLCAVVWFFYGFLIKDYYIATPNILGFVFGLAQMMLYLVYKNDSMCLNQQIQPTEGDSSKDGDDNHHQVKTNNQEVEVVVVN